MNKLICLLILIPFVSFANFHRGIMTFTNDTTKKGFIEIPNDSENNKIKFRLEEKGSTEKYRLEQIKFFIIYDEKGKEVKFVITHLAKFKMFSKDPTFKIQEEWACVKVVQEGKINLYSAWYMETGAGGGAIGGATISGNSFTSGDLYINRIGQDYSLQFYAAGSNGFPNKEVFWKNFLKLMEIHFGNECPNLVKLIDKDDLKKNGYGRIVALYEQNCGAK